MQNIYVVRQNSDMTEGRGAMIPKIAFTTAVDANEASKGMHAYREDDGMADVVAFPLYSSIHDFNENNDKAVKAKALAKLTDYEKKILGLI